MDNILNLFPGAQSVVVAPIFGLCDGFTEFSLSEYIRIVPRNDIIDAAYLPLVKMGLNPDFYMVGIAQDMRYHIFPLKIENESDATASITLAQLALSIYCKSPLFLGTSICFSKFIHSPLILSRPSIEGDHWELSDELIKLPKSPYCCTQVSNASFNQELVEFFIK